MAINLVYRPPASRGGLPRIGGTVNVDIDQLKSLFALLRDEEIAEFEHEADGVRVKIVRGGRVELAPIAHAPRPAAGAAAATVEEVPADTIDITSPFVGTFYRSPTPDAPPFADVGSVVRKGQTLCIVEAMKLMNEIEAECSGTIVDVFVQNGKTVEYGQKLYRIKKT